MNRNFVSILTYQIKNVKKYILMKQNAHNEIYKILSFEKIKLITKKLLCLKIII